MLELEELAGAVGGFAEGDDAGVSDDLLERLHVREAVTRFGCRETHCVSGDPLDDGLVVEAPGPWQSGQQQGCDQDSIDSHRLSFRASGGSAVFQYSGGSPGGRVFQRR